jgi:hypothetical protein
MAGLTWLAKAGDLLDKLDKTAAETIAAAGDDDDFDDEDVEHDIERMLKDGATEEANGEKTEEAEARDEDQKKDDDGSNSSKGSGTFAKANPRDPVSRYVLNHVVNVFSL